MNSEQSPQSLAPSQLNLATPKKTNQFQSFLQKHLVSTIIISTCVNFGLTSAATWSVWNTSQQLEINVSKQDRQQELNSKVIYLDEVLTMSALMYTNTGLPEWEKRYNDAAPVFDKNFAEFTQNITQSAGMKAASKKLFEMEEVAFKLTKQGKLKEASLLLVNAEYKKNKQVQNDEFDVLATKIRTAAESQVKADRQSLSDAILLALLSLGLFVATGSLVVLTVRSYIRDREQAQKSLQAFQTDLIGLNEQLQQEDKLRSAQKNQIEAESEMLQLDIGHILDVVSLLEDGNLTAQAQVNDRSTGLISDTLNRLIESLHQVISVVVSSADRVVDSAEGLEQVAVETASQAQTQTRSIQEIAALIAKVNALSSDSRDQALATTDAVQLAKAAVGNGQQEMDAMADGIAQLQQATEQIVRRVERLNEFVELAAQFSKDQKRSAALTRVLALNASLLSTRAVKEQDPNQFASLANEFETIADRVNELAEDNNTSLISLQHRTNQIQTVTSGLNQDITDINQLVQKFTGEMGKSRQAFTNIQLVTDQVAIVGDQVNASSQDIIRMVGETLAAIQSIGVIAQNTEQKATVTREQIHTMGDLAQNLLSRVEFFRLNNQSQNVPPKALPPADSTAVKNPEAVYALLQSPAN
jgi:methyl-accepting chemotaxis protein PixJ